MDSHRLLDSPNQVFLKEPCNILQNHILIQHNLNVPFMMNAEKSIAVLINSGSVDGGFVASVVGGGVGVDNSGGGENDCNGCGMTVENTGEDSNITETCTVRSVDVCWLGTS
ncbi:hypothetical protein Tco_1254589 [Tanacetum coccineum]